jgi:cytochrome c oxidase assembly protein subunit 15
LTSLAQSDAIRITLWLRRLALVGVLLGFGVVMLGAYVRLTAAGLGCPDWPGCYGHVTPLGAAQSAALGNIPSATPLDLGKAWREMIHRYAATTLGLVIVLITALVIAARDSVTVRTRYVVVLLGTVVLQGALGMLTVTWQLKPLIVTLHLLFGLTTLALLWWLWLSLRAPDARSGAGRIAEAARIAPAIPPRKPQRLLACVALGILVVQIALGGWTSSNYAAIACPDFPTCQGSWWPPMDFRDAFVLFRAPSINYEGGVLANAARVAIHFTHRMGALAVTAALLTAALAVLREPALRAQRLAAAAVIAALALQLTIGVSMVVRGFPLWLATAHNGGAALTLLAVIALLHGVYRATPSAADAGI